MAKSTGKGEQESSRPQLLKEDHLNHAKKNISPSCIVSVDEVDDIIADEKLMV